MYSLSTRTMNGQSVRLTGNTLRTATCRVVSVLLMAANNVVTPTPSRVLRQSKA